MTQTVTDQIAEAAPTPSPTAAPTQRPVPPGGFRFDARTLFAILGTAAIAFAMWMVAGRLGPAGAIGNDRAAVERIVHDYILANPEILPQAMENLQRKGQARPADVAALLPALQAPEPGAVAGNPQGRTVLVEFFDFSCGFCRQSVADVERLIAANPDLKVVHRDLPVLAPESVEAAKMALAAGRQGKYRAYYLAQFEAGRPTPETIRAAARKAGVDLAQAEKDMADPATEQALQRNLDFARKLGFNGTPSFVVGDQMLAGAVGYEALKRAVDTAAAR